MRQYFEERPVLLYGSILGSLAAASVLALFVGRLVSASPTSRIGRVGKTLQAWAPILAGAFLLFFWAAYLGSRIGYFSVASQIYLIGVLLIISLALMGRNRIIVRMAIRNLGRRKTSFAIVIAGLMIGTAMISGSLVTGDTLTDLFTKGSYFAYGHADEVVYALDFTSTGNRPQYTYFDYSVYVSLRESLEFDTEASAVLRGVTPEIVQPVSVLDRNTGVGSSEPILVGTPANASQVLGNFHDSNGRVISSISDSLVIVDERTARDLNATVGDALQIFGPQPAAQRANFTIAAIAVEDERGLFGAMHVFVTLNAAQTLMQQPGMVNYLAITNVGGLRPSIQHSETVGLAANRTLNQLQNPVGPGCKSSSGQIVGTTTILCAYAEKKAGVDSAIESAQSLSNLFLVMSSFSIIAGVVLIINIFVMLAEERKSEMGMSRAIGMKRGHLTRLFLFEGTVYAVASALVGVFAGIIIAYGVLYVFGQIITGFFNVDLSIVLGSFTFTALTLTTAFTAGLFITYNTILLASWRTSKLNIIRAIRDIPEPPRGVRTYTVLSILGILLILVGIFLNQASFAAESAVMFLVAPSLIILGVGLILSRFLRNRFAFTLAGLALLVQWGVPQLSWTNSIIADYTFGPELFFVGGLVMVVGAIMVFMFNTDVIVRFLRIFYRVRRSLVPVFRISFSYPSNKKFRTTAAVAMFALVIFTVTTIAVIAAEQSAALASLTEEFSGGYDLVVQTAPLANLTDTLSSNLDLAGKVEGIIPFKTVSVGVTDLTQNRSYGSPTVVGADPNALGPDNFFDTNKFSIVSYAPGYTTPKEVWDTVRSDPSRAVWSTSFVSQTGPPQELPTPDPGDTLLLVSRNGTTTVEVVAVLNGVFFSGVVSTSDFVESRFGVNTGSLAFVSVPDGVDPTEVSVILRRDYLQLNLQTLVIPVLVSDFVEVGNSFLALFQGFLGLGLVVGIAGLGIIAIRSVVERRREIGMLRALGFRRSMVLAAFLLENSYITLLGIGIGVILGLNLGYAISQTGGVDLPYVIPWLSIFEIVGIAYGLAMLATVGSAFRASNIPPAEALRYTE